MCAESGVETWGGAVILADVAILAVSSNRTRLYLFQMWREQLLPAHVFYLEDPAATTHEHHAAARHTRAVPEGTDRAIRRFLDTPLPQLLGELGLSYERLKTLDPNADMVVDAVKRNRSSIVIYSGPGGAILKAALLGCGRRFLHVHPGILPAFRGSTTTYYSLLQTGECGASALFLNERIDTGPIIRTRRFPRPDDPESIDLYYDPWIRSELLIEILRDYASSGALPEQQQDYEAGETYFVIHPVLKHIAIMARPSFDQASDL